MNITTKYNIGQNVWIFVNDGAKTKVKQVTIQDINTYNSGKWSENGPPKILTSIVYKFDLGGEIVSLNEVYIFETKEQAAASILNS